MKKIWMFLVMIAISFSSYAANEWRNSTGENTILGTENPSDIDTASFRNIVDPLDRLLKNYKTVYLDYATASTLTVKAGEVVCSNSDSSIRKMRSNAADLTVTWANIDTGTELDSTTYYVYLVADADSEEYTATISSDSTTPSGKTYYIKIGSFYNDASGNITLINNYNNYSEFGSYLSKSSGTTYQATSDGYVVAYFIPGGIYTMAGYTDSSSSPSTLVAYVGAGPDQTTLSFTYPVKSGDYWKVTVSGGSATIRWLPKQ